MAVACNMDQVAMIQRPGCSNPCSILVDRRNSGDRLGVVGAEEVVGREDLGEKGYGLIECAGSEHAPWRFGRTVVADPRSYGGWETSPPSSRLTRLNLNA